MSMIMAAMMAISPMNGVATMPSYAPDLTTASTSDYYKKRYRDRLRESLDFQAIDGHIRFNLKSRLSTSIPSVDDGVIHPRAGKRDCFGRFQPAGQVIGSGGYGDCVRAGQRVGFLHGRDETAPPSAVCANSVSRAGIRVHRVGVNAKAGLDAALRLRGGRHEK